MPSETEAPENSSRGSAEGWLSVVDALRSSAGEFGTFQVVAKAKGPFFTRRYRSRVKLPICSVSLSRETWEICLLAPGLAFPNPKAESGLALLEFLEEMETAIAAAPQFCVVLSDEFSLDRKGLQHLATRRGSEWTGPDLETLQENEYFGRIDLPVRGVVIRPHLKRREILLEMRV